MTLGKRLAWAAALTAATIVAARAQAPVEKFRGVAIVTTPFPGVIAATRGADAFQVAVKRNHLTSLLPPGATADPTMRGITLRVGAALLDFQQPPCTDDGFAAAKQCLANQRKSKVGRFDMATGPVVGDASKVGAMRYKYYADAKRPGQYVACVVIEGLGDEFGSCVLTFRHGDIDFRADMDTFTDKTDLGLWRCAALRLSQKVWIGTPAFEKDCM
jgi:hypothetical protein